MDCYVCGCLLICRRRSGVQAVIMIERKTIYQHPGIKLCATPHIPVINLLHNKFIKYDICSGRAPDIFYMTFLLFCHHCKIKCFSGSFDRGGIMTLVLRKFIAVFGKLHTNLKWKCPLINKMPFRDIGLK